MAFSTVSRTIEAPLPRVFRTVADIQKFSQAVPHIAKVEMLSEQTKGVGARFRETRLIKGKQAATELEVTEYVENEKIRLVTDTHGCVWDSVFTVEEKPNGTMLTLVMDARPHKFLAKVMNVFIRGMIGKAIANDLDAVKEYCEREENKNPKQDPS